jgi:hypothetical protein
MASVRPDAISLVTCERRKKNEDGTEREDSVSFLFFRLGPSGYNSVAYNTQQHPSTELTRTDKLTPQHNIPGTSLVYGMLVVTCPSIFSRPVGILCQIRFNDLQWE